ncbi:rhomboid family intramembrane serine protease [Nocardioides sp. Kera G14]|uniref:rhomboid family intramembrane serine protease n=1 Tax=Nocardioides sp. Kera G14 TaxID=2884264 RepID=UPI001D12F795|nr:rhomboid family intramembrane serine protease [Nocardioides sp. Kera G14]UDY25426.1 rhomboid family intramembrane serine protease [Nocardioides sp. Kera G14]
MVSASVGFQCPECVHEGNRSVRQARTTYGGLIPRGLSVSLVLVALNVAVWIAIQASGGDSSKIVDWFGLLPRGICTVPGGYYPGLSDNACDVTGGSWVPGVADGALWRMVTSVFTQVTPMHLFLNILNIWILGPQLEQAFGRARFLAIYALAGLAGSITILWLSEEYSNSIGASGAVFGLLGALLVMVLRTKQAPQGMLIWIVLSMGYSFLVPGISWQGHLGGLLGGFLVTAAFAWAPRGPRRHLLQWGSVAVFLVILAVLTAVRIHELAAPLTGITPS